MRWNVSQLLKAGVGEDREFEFNEAQPHIEELASGVEGTVRLIRTKAGILAMVSAETSAASVCSRCLTPVAIPAHLEIEEEFLPTLDIESGVALAHNEDDGAFTINAQHELDLTEPIRQYTILSLPIKPLCRPDCKGLCPTCGKNLNDGPCSCKAQAADPRWEALEGLKAKVSKSEKRK